MLREEPPDGTITGAEGGRAVAPEAWFTPTSARGDGTLLVRDTLAGFIYAGVKYPEFTGQRKRVGVWRFSALDEQHHELQAFGDQGSALAYLVRRAQGESN